MRRIVALILLVAAACAPAAPVDCEALHWDHYAAIASKATMTFPEALARCETLECRRAVSDAWSVPGAESWGVDEWDVYAGEKMAACLSR